MDRLDRVALADMILERLKTGAEEMSRQWRDARISHFVCDDLLPEDIARKIYDSFPLPGTMKMKKSLREYKYIAAQMNQYNPLLEEAVYAFQDPRVLKLVSQITGVAEMLPDENLYAGGISMMDKGKYLNPHVDNSHDKDRQNYRVMNLLYYVTPDWDVGNGGNLELWPDGPKGTPQVVFSRFNRLAVMVTHQTSWHSVSPVVAEGRRCCVSNYYFSPRPYDADEYFHVTSFRGRPEQPIRDLLLRADIGARMLLRKLFPKGVRENPHVYKRPS
jgi:Rps23 Pro-64 3,4-dihydroxylase Tpa1-like proline 4-hydroxylase